MKTKLTFSDPSFQKINEEAESVISKHLEELDRISNDIKALEERLKISGSPFTFTYLISSDKERCTGTAYYYCDVYEQVPYTAQFDKYTESCLFWGKNKDNDHRLSLNIYTTEDEIETYVTDDGKRSEKLIAEGIPLLLSSKPLIETKSNVRVKFYKELLGFYTSFIEALKTKRDQECIYEYSSNYNRQIAAKIDPDPIQFIFR